MSVADFDREVADLPRGAQIAYWTQRVVDLDAALAHHPVGSKAQYPLRQARVELARLNAIRDA